MFWATFVELQAFHISQKAQNPKHYIPGFFIQINVENYRRYGQGHSQGPIPLTFDTCD